MSVAAAVGSKRASRVRSVVGGVALRAGRVLEKQFRRPALAEFAYQRAHTLAPDRPDILFRLGRVRERRTNWPGAAEAYAAGVALGPPNPEAYLTRRARVLERQGRWADAVTDYRAALSVMPSATLMRRLAKDLKCDGRLPDAIFAFEEAIKHGTTPKLLAGLAESYADFGAFDAASRAYAQAVDLNPENLTVRTNLGRVAARRSVMPFELVDGLTTPVAEGVHQRALAEAIAQLAHIVNASESRVWAAYWLGRLQESHRLLPDALMAYDTAITRVQNVDTTWAHHAEQAWRFRRLYVEHRISGEPSADPRINRTVTPGVPRDDVSEVVGFFEVWITNVGVHVEGFVIHGHDGNVELCLDGRPILSVAANVSAWHGDFKTTIVHNVVGEFPHRSQLTLRVGDAPLATFDGARSVEVVVPDGTNRLGALLSGGRVITKKGRWSDAGIQTRSKDVLYFSAYSTAKKYFEDELGIKLFLCYGTLLGCYRDGRLIPGDDDFDVSYISEATTTDELKEEGRRVIEALLRGGFDCRVAVDGRMFHLRVDDVVLDVNPLWFYDGRAWSFNAHSLSRDVFDPVTSMTVSGVEVYLPGNTEAFLAENYGLDWSTPRSDFRYHRGKADVITLRRARLLPSEVKALQVYSEQLRRENPSVGRFYGYSDPASPIFD